MDDLVARSTPWSAETVPTQRHGSTSSQRPGTAVSPSSTSLLLASSCIGERRDGRMATEKFKWVHLTTKHVSSINMHHVSDAQHAANGASAAEQSPDLAHDSPQFIKKLSSVTYFKAVSCSSCESGGILVEVQKFIDARRHMRQSFDSMQTTKILRSGHRDILKLVTS